ncbi:MAG: toll/interleukin-1 receptor domain-containing protein, partial [Sphingomicrobium sp.]
MASVFLSYDREDTNRARLLAAALEKAGHSVWWDRRITSGAQFSKAIENALNTAEAVVVLWSRQSVESAWVRDEAAAGRDTGRLVP